MDKEDVLYIYNGILLSHKKEWNNAIYSNMGQTYHYHTKWNKSDRERQISYDITYINLEKNDAKNLLTKQKQTHILRKQTYGYQRGKGVEERLISSLGLADTDCYI